jgi:regulatory protein
LRSISLSRFFVDVVDPRAMIIIVKKQPGKITRASLERAALFRLERRALSVAQLRRSLQQKVKRAEKFHGVVESASEWIDDVINRCISSGLLDDQRVAAGRAAALRDRGMSSRMIMMRLKQKGIAAELAEQSLNDVDRSATAELDAACAYVRRRKLHDKDPQKALAALARQGFAFAIARRALESPT